MKSFEELISRFNDIEDLPVSEEMLGAYVEGNLIGSEFREINNLVNADKSLLELISDCKETISSENIGCNLDVETIKNLDVIDRLPVFDLQEQDFMDIVASVPDFGAQDSLTIWGIATNAPHYSQDNDNIDNITDDTNNDDIINLNS